MARDVWPERAVASTKKLSAPVLVLTSVGSARAATVLARALLKSRLCACVSLVSPVRSLYWWKGTLHDERETLLVIKSVRRQVAALRRRLLQIHPYEVPEVLVLAASASATYGSWLNAETARRKGPM